MRESLRERFGHVSVGLPIYVVFWTAIWLLRRAFLEYELSSLLARAVPGVLAIVAAFGLFRLKRKNLLIYARLEASVAVAIIADAVLNAEVNDIMVALRLSGGVYLLVRSLDNSANAKAIQSPA
jgi:hypothetical protein